MADRFNDGGINAAISGSGLVGASAVEIEMQEGDGTPSNFDPPEFSQNPDIFNTSTRFLPADNRTLGTKTATGNTSFDKLQWRVDYGSGFQRLFRIDNINEGGIALGEDVTVRTGSLECPTVGLANVIRDGLSAMTIDVEVVDDTDAVQKTFSNVSYSYSTSSDTFTLDNPPLEFQNNTGAQFTIVEIRVFANSDLFFKVQRNDQVVDGAQVEITQLENTLTNLTN